MHHQYSVYGVSLTSDIPFDFPKAGPTLADGPRVRFERGGDEHFAGAAAQGAEQSPWFVCRELGDGSVYFRWSALYEFQIDPEGSCVRYRPLADGDPLVLQNFLFGQTLSFALIRQNVEPVHAAIVDVGGFAIALLGDCTYGKSTLAGSLLAQGCRLVSDDVLVVRRVDGRLYAQAGTGRIKLMPDSARAVLGRADGVPLTRRAEKRIFTLDEPFVQRREVPLRALVVLPTPDERAVCDRIEMQAIGRAMLFHVLVQNTFVRYLDDGRRLHQNFAANTQLASAAAGYQLRYPAGIDRLPLVASTLIDHVRLDSQGEFR